MPRQLPISIFALSVAGLIGVAAWDYTLTQDNAQLTSQVHTLKLALDKEIQASQEIKQQMQQAQATLQQQQSSLAQQQKVQASDLQMLMAKVADERGHLQALRQKIDDLKNTKIDDRAATTPKRLDEDNGRILDLEKQLRYLLAEEKDLNQQGVDAIKNEKGQTTYQMETLNSEITTQNEAIRTTQDQVNFWKKQYRDPNRTSKLDEYQNQLNSQRADLQKLKTQKLNLSQEDQSQTGAIKNNVGQSRQELKDSENQIQEQLKLARAELKNRQKAQNNQSAQSQKDKQALHNELQQAEQSYTLEYNQYRSDEALLQKKQRDAEGLNAKPPNGKSGP